MCEKERSVTINFNETDLKKLEVLKTRYGYRKNIDIIRYLMTAAIEKIIDDPLYKQVTETHVEEKQKKEFESSMRVPAITATYPYS